MAHLEDDKLPSNFDVIVVGTGMDRRLSILSIANYIDFFLKGLTESILAAALSRDGKQVLHLDRLVSTNVCFLSVYKL